jgi:hypothetical protein
LGIICRTSSRKRKTASQSRDVATLARDTVDSTNTNRGSYLASSSVVVVVVVVSSVAGSVAGVEGVVVVVVVLLSPHPATTIAAHTSINANKLLIAISPENRTVRKKRCSR